MSLITLNEYMLHAIMRMVGALARSTILDTTKYELYNECPLTYIVQCIEMLPYTCVSCIKLEQYQINVMHATETRFFSSQTS